MITIYFIKIKVLLLLICIFHSQVINLYIDMMFIRVSMFRAAGIVKKSNQINSETFLYQQLDDTTKASLSENFMSLFPTHPDFGNSAEEFHGDETLSTPMKLLSSLSSLIWCHISIINAHETLIKPH
jgi:hypothetical protein